MLSAIRKAMETRLATLAPAWETAWENVNYTPRLGVSYQRASLLPGAPLAVGVFAGAVLRHMGFLQVDVCIAAPGGAAASDARCVALQTLFKRGTSLAVDGAIQNLWVPEQPNIGPSFFESTWRVTPVSIAYELLASP